MNVTTTKLKQPLIIDAINQALLNALETATASPLLKEAMRYSLMAPGKRLRGQLVIAVGLDLGASFESLLTAAVAIEAIHTFSLIHDDLPAMDDDDIRRGQPSCHKQFSEATAILAGDALLSLAFERLSHDTHPAKKTLQMIQTLASASGATGMIAGQMLDEQAAGHTISIDQLKQIHQYKTGALLQAACILGAIIADADQTTLDQIKKMGQHLGLAFQIQDDILDVTSDSETLGKPQQSDLKNHKNTYISLLGLEQAKQACVDEFYTVTSTLNQTTYDYFYLNRLLHEVKNRNH